MANTDKQRLDFLSQCFVEVLSDNHHFSVHGGNGLLRPYIDDAIRFSRRASKSVQYRRKRKRK